MSSTTPTSFVPRQHPTKMCVQPYHGFSCGHRDPSATPLNTELCGPPGRKAHEPPCSGAHLSWRCIPSTKKCPSCSQIFRDNKRAWKDSAEHFALAGIPAIEVNYAKELLDRDVGGLFDTFASWGPDHARQHELRGVLDAEVLRVWEFAGTLRGLDREWEERVRGIERTGRISAGDARYVRERRSMERRRTWRETVRRLRIAETTLLTPWECAEWSEET